MAIRKDIRDVAVEASNYTQSVKNETDALEPEPSDTLARPSHRLKGLLMFGLLMIALLVSHRIFSPQGEQQKKSAEVNVTTAKAVLRDVPVQQKLIGTVTAVNSVAVKAHVAGQIVDTYFKEGDSVKRGQPLFLIDPRPFEAAVSQAQADVLNKEALVSQAEAAIARDEALLNQAKAANDKAVALAAYAASQETSYSFLSKQGAVSKMDYEQYRTNAVSAQAGVKSEEANIVNLQAVVKSARANLQSAKAQLAASQAALRNAKVQLAYTSVTAPIDGVAGNIQILQGNLVRQDLDTLLLINQINPIYISLAVPESDSARLRKHARTTSEISAEAFTSAGELIAKDGKFVFANNTVDATTGTVLVKVLFENSHGRMWPGQFANVVLKLGTMPDAVTIPDSALQTGQAGKFVWVVNDRSRAQMQAVTTGPTVDRRTVVTSGIVEGQQVVTDGHLQLTPDAKVNVTAAKGHD